MSPDVSLKYPEVSKILPPNPLSYPPEPHGSVCGVEVEVVALLFCCGCMHGSCGIIIIGIIIGIMGSIGGMPPAWSARHLNGAMHLPDAAVAPLVVSKHGHMNLLPGFVHFPFESLKSPQEHSILRGTHIASASDITASVSCGKSVAAYMQPRRTTPALNAMMRAADPIFPAFYHPSYHFCERQKRSSAYSKSSPRRRAACGSSASAATNAPARIRAALSPFKNISFAAQKRTP